MCSLAAMPADYDVIAVHSPPVFSHSPPSYFTPSYNTCRLSTPPAAHPRPSPTQLRRSNTAPVKLSHPPPPKSDRTPRRPCLVLRTDDSSSSSDDSDLSSPTRLKKKVVFADDRGLSLTQVSRSTSPL